MNAATFDFQHYDEKKSSQIGVVCLPQKRTPSKANPLVNDHAYWTNRAQVLLSVYNDESLPTTSGTFGSFLY